MDRLSSQRFACALVGLCALASAYAPTDLEAQRPAIPRAFAGVLGALSAATAVSFGGTAPGAHHYELVRSGTDFRGRVACGTEQLDATPVEVPATTMIPLLTRLAEVRFLDGGPFRAPHPATSVLTIETPRGRVSFTSYQSGCIPRPVEIAVGEARGDVSFEVPMEVVSALVTLFGRDRCAARSEPLDQPAPQQGGRLRSAGRLRGGSGAGVLRGPDPAQGSR